MARRSTTLRFKLLLAFALSLVIGWSVLWFVSATIAERQVDRALMTAGQNGAMIDCTHRAVTGFPFRLELRCGTGTTAQTPAMEASVSGVTMAALIYRPQRMIAEMRGPATFSLPELPPIEADWDLAHASFRLDLGNAAMRRVDAEVVKGAVSMGGLALDLEELDLNLREDPIDPGALNFALRLDRVESALLVAPVTLTAQGTLSEGAALLAGQADDVLRAVLLSGAPVVLDAVTLEHGEMALSATGRLNLDGAGLLTGELALALAGEEMAARYVAALLPEEQRGSIGTLVEGLLKNTPATGEVAGRPAKEIALNFDSGKVRVGAFPFPLPFQIPPVRVAAR